MPKKPAKKKRMKPMKAWAVQWRKEVRSFWGVLSGEIILPVEPKEDIKVNFSRSKKGRPKYLYADPLAIFKFKKEAEAYRAGNRDFEVVPVIISLE